MKKTISRRILSLALALCLLLSLAPAMNLVSEADALTDNWQSVYVQTNPDLPLGKLEIDANDPFSAKFINRVSAYYTKKIDVQTGTKISFDVNFPVIDTVLQYGFALMDRPNATHQYPSNGNGGTANGLVA